MHEVLLDGALAGVAVGASSLAVMGLTQIEEHATTLKQLGLVGILCAMILALCWLVWYLVQIIIDNSKQHHAQRDAETKQQIADERARTDTLLRAVESMRAEIATSNELRHQSAALMVEVKNFVRDSAEAVRVASTTTAAAAQAMQETARECRRWKQAGV